MLMHDDGQVCRTTNTTFDSSRQNSAQAFLFSAIPHSLAQYLGELPIVRSRSPVPDVLNEMRQSMHCIFADRQVLLVSAINHIVEPINQFDRININGQE